MRSQSQKFYPQGLRVHLKRVRQPPLVFANDSSADIALFEILEGFCLLLDKNFRTLE